MCCFFLQWIPSLIFLTTINKSQHQIDNANPNPMHSNLLHKDIKAYPHYTSMRIGCGLDPV